MPSAEERFRAKVRRHGGHEVWTGAKDDRGVGMVRIDGQLRTVQRASWEFAYGPLPPGVRVNTCADERACVTVAHLSLSPARAQALHTQARRRRGSGSIRELHSGVWQLAITDTTVRRRRYLTVEGNRNDAESALDRVRALLHRDDLGDLRVRELVGRYLEVTDPDARRASTPDRDRLLLHDYIEPAIGDELAALVTSDEIRRGLEAAAHTGAPLARSSRRPPSRSRRLPMGHCPPLAS